MTDVRQPGMPPPSPHWKDPTVASASASASASGSGSGRVSRYESTKLRPGARSLVVPGMLCVVLLSIQIVSYLVIAADWFLNRSYWGEYHQFETHNFESDNVAKVMGHRYADAIGIGVGALVIVLVVILLMIPTFIWWFQRAYRNLARQEFDPAWAYFAWFVPILNIWRPKQLANRIWRTSVSPRLGPSVQWWWFGPWFLAFGPLVGYASIYSAREGGSYGAIGVTFAIVCLIQATVPLALLLMIRRVTRAQDPLIEAADRLDAMPAPVSAAAQYASFH